MSFVSAQKNATRHSAGIGIAMFSIVLVWGLMSGLAREVVHAISAPMEAKLIEEVKPRPHRPR